MAYECQSCGEAAFLQGEIQHGPECKNRLASRKVCLKSGQHPHCGDEK